jgi:hypothetical protein
MDGRIISASVSADGGELMTPFTATPIETGTDRQVLKLESTETSFAFLDPALDVLVTLHFSNYTEQEAIEITLAVTVTETET